VESSIVFHAEVAKVMTMADGSVRVWLDLPETEIPQMAMLAECKRMGIYLAFEASVDEN
jgi:hypothetical protein